MVKVSMEVCNGAARFCVAVRAEGIWRAVCIVEGRYPGPDIGVKFPIDPGDFFVEDPPTPAGVSEIEQSKKMAA